MIKVISAITLCGLMAASFSAFAQVGQKQIVACSQATTDSACKVQNPPAEMKNSLFLMVLMVTSSSGKKESHVIGAYATRESCDNARLLQSSETTCTQS